MHHRNIASNAGPDVLLMILSFYLMLSPAGAAYSLDARRADRKRGTVAEPLIVPWAQRLIQFQLALVYLVGIVWKCHGTTWLNGTAVHLVLSNTEFHRSSLVWLQGYPIAINLLTHLAMALECALPFLIWFRAARPWVIWAGVGLHIGIMFMVNIPIFGELMMASYLTFLGPDELDTLLRCLNPRTWMAWARGALGLDRAAWSVGQGPAPQVARLARRR